MKKEGQKRRKRLTPKQNNIHRITVFMDTNIKQDEVNTTQLFFF